MSSAHLRLADNIQVTSATFANVLDDRKLQYSILDTVV